MSGSVQITFRRWLTPELHSCWNLIQSDMHNFRLHDSDDVIFDEEAENACAFRLTESTIDVNTGEKVAYQLENGVSTGKFVLFSLYLLFCLCL